MPSQIREKAWTARDSWGPLGCPTFPHVSLLGSNCLEVSQVPAGKLRPGHRPLVPGQGWTTTWGPSWGRRPGKDSAPGQETGPAKGTDSQQREIHTSAFWRAGGLDFAVRAPVCPPRTHAEIQQQPPAWPDLSPLDTDQSLLTGSLETETAGGLESTETTCFPERGGNQPEVTQQSLRANVRDVSPSSARESLLPTTMASIRGGFCPWEPGLIL